MIKNTGFLEGLYGDEIKASANVKVFILIKINSTVAFTQALPASLQMSSGQSDGFV